MMVAVAGRCRVNVEMEHGAGKRGGGLELVVELGGIRENQERENSSAVPLLIRSHRKREVLENGQPRPSHMHKR